MRIMHLINHCGRANGHVNVSVDMACWQAKAGHQVAYTCSNGHYIELLELYGVQCFHAPEPHRNVLQFFESGNAIWRAVRAFRPDIIHVHMAAQIIMVQPLRLLGYKIVSTVHNEFDRSVWVMGLATRIVAVSKAGAAAMVRRGFSKKAVRVVLNGTIGSPRMPSSFIAAEISRPAVITVCGMHPRKGIADLLNAFAIMAAAVSEVHLYLVGEGPTQPAYESLAQSLGLSDRVHFLGYHEDPRRFLAAADIFILASHADPGPLVIGEARNAGCAIVATNVDGIPEMLDDGAAGILVEPRRPDLIAAAVLPLLQNPAMLRDYKNRAHVNVERFSIARVCRDMDQIYEELVPHPLRAQITPIQSDGLAPP